MTDLQKVILIPARKGSGKNLWRLGDRTLLSWICNAAMQAHDLVDRIIVSTDYSRDEASIPPGIEVWPRPPLFAKGDIPIHQWLIPYLQGYLPPSTVVVLLQPTSPFVRREDITFCADLPLTQGGRCTLTKVSHTSHWQNQRCLLEKSRAVSFRYPTDRKTRKQDKEAAWKFGNCLAFHASGQDVTAETGLFTEDCYGLETDPKYALDIDTPWDLTVANALIQTGVYKETDHA